MKNIILLPFLVLALSIPLTVNAAATNSTTVTLDENTTPFIFKNAKGVGTNANTVSTVFASLADQGGTSSVYRYASGTGESNSFFSVVENTPLFSGTLNSNLSSTVFSNVSLINVTTGQTTALTIDHQTGAYTYSGLVAGNVYDSKFNYNTVSTGASIYTSTTVAAIPEPEEWAMMLIGLFLIAVKINQSKKSENQLNCLAA